MLRLGRSESRSEQKCIVRLLDDEEILECGFQPHHKGQFLLDAVCQQMNLLEKDYFGLRYVDSHSQRHWLDLTKAILKQIKSMNPIVFCFRVKFYPRDPHRLKEELTRYQIFLQLRRDLQHGRLYTTQEEAVTLGALIVQSEIGDFDPDEHFGNYVADMKILLRQTEEIEEAIMRGHQTQLKGQVPAVAERNFLRRASLLDTYGVDPHSVEDQDGNQLYLGINFSGILTLQGAKKTHHFRWSEIHKINFEGKMYILHVILGEKKRTLGFKCPSHSACRHIWRCSVEQQLFFTLPSSSAAPPVVTGGSIFSRGSRFRYSGRTERELRELSGAISRDPTFFKDSSSALHRRATSMPAIQSEQHTIRRSNHSAAPLSEPACIGSDMEDNPHSAHSQLHPLIEDPEGNNHHHAYMDMLPVPRGALPPTLSLEHSQYEGDLALTNPFTSPTPSAASSPRTQLSPLVNHMKGCGCVRVVIPAFFLVLLAMFVLMVIVFETDWDSLRDLKNVPEMILLKRGYYEPLKGFFLKKLGVP